jgi:hypothetical protein
MPEQSDKDIEGWLKGRGYDFGEGKTPDRPNIGNAGPPAGGSAEATPTNEPGPVGSAIESVHDYIAGPEGVSPQMRRGAGKALTSTALGAASLAGQLLPTSVRRTLGQLAGSVPGVKQAQEFANEPYQSFSEGVGGVGADVVTGLATPEFGLGRLAARAVPATRTVPTLTHAATPPAFVKPLGLPGRFMQTAGQWVPGTKQVQNPNIVQNVTRAGQVVENAAKGAAGGAVANPDDPTTGAEYGALGGLGQRGLGAALRNRFGAGLGGILFRYVPASVLGGLIGYQHGGTHEGVTGALTGAGGTAAHHALSGARHGLTHSVRGYHGVGHQLHQAGRASFDNAGRFLGYVDPVTGGLLTGRATRSDVSPSNVYERAKEAVSPEQRDLNPYTEEDYRAQPGPPQDQ